MRHAGFVRNFESTLRLLAERGHDVHVAFDRDNAFYRLGEGTSIIERLAAEHERLSFGPGPDRDDDPWFSLSTRLRRSIDYLRYLEPPYEDAPKLRARAERHAPPIVSKLAAAAARLPGGVAALGRALRAMERSIEPSEAIAGFIREREPDAVLVTPLVELGAPQADYVRVAKELAVPTVLCVASWDNLTNKGLIAAMPDRVAVWNEAQRREAIDLHGVPAEQVVATGAQTYDHWFEWDASTSRDEFAERVGLRPDRPFVLYLCSSGFIAPREAGFVKDWVRRLREHPEHGFDEVGVLIRPHPRNAAQWDGIDLSDLDEVAVFPAAGADPIDPRSKADYYDSIFHCAAVVGVNTSALIESAIVGRRVYTWLAPDFRETQGGTLHFGHLTEHGLLNVAETFDEHARQLAGGVEEEARDPSANRAFLEFFVRPGGLEQPATPRLVEEVENAPAARTELGAAASEPAAAPASGRAMQALLTPLAHASRLQDLRLAVARGAIRGIVGIPVLRWAAERYLVPLLGELKAALRADRAGVSDQHGSPVKAKRAPITEPATVSEAAERDQAPPAGAAGTTAAATSGEIAARDAA